MSLTGIRGSEQCISVVKLPTDCRPQCPAAFFLFAPLFFLVPIPSFPQRNFAPGSPRNDDRQLGQPTTSLVCPSSCAFLFPKVDRSRHRIASEKSWRSTPKQRPIDGGGVHLASKIDHFWGYFQRLSRTKATESSRLMERAMGIEPMSEAW